MKICAKCKEEKDLSEFRDRVGRRGAMIKQPYCTPCQSQYHRDHYNKHRERYISQVGTRKAEVRRNLALYLQSHPCVDCGEADPIVLDFDHLGDKIIGISKAVENGWSWPRLLTEIQKCEVRCANCHRRRTSKQFNWYNASMV